MIPMKCMVNKKLPWSKDAESRIEIDMKLRTVFEVIGFIILKMWSVSVEKQKNIYTKSSVHP